MEKLNINGIDTSLIKTKKYKTLSFLITFVGEFTKDNATSRFLLSRVLCNSSKKYQTKKIMANKLFDLYDANISVSTIKLHKVNLTLFYLEVINPHFTKDENHLKDAIDFLKEIIFNPNVENGGFREEVFNEEKRMLSDSIKNIYNNKPYYAFNRLLEVMGKDEIVSVSSLGTIEDLEKITKESLYEFYLDSIKNEEVKIYAIGDITENELSEYFKDFPFNHNRVNLESYSKEIKVIDEVKEVIEKQEINQAQLLMGFRTNITYGDKLYLPLVIFNMMLGGMASSDLFRVIREENSLSYSVGSNVLFPSKILIITAGIDQKNYNLATDLIIKEIERYKTGDINEELIEIAKINFINSLKETNDEPTSLLIFEAKKDLQKTKSLEELIEKSNLVTKEEIMEASKLLELDTIYMLRGEGNE